MALRGPVVGVGVRGWGGHMSCCRAGCKGPQPPSGGSELEWSLPLATFTQHAGLSDSLVAAGP